MPNIMEHMNDLIIDYVTAKECQIPTYGICHKCGKCGRKFENGFMIDNGGTTPDEEWL